MAAPRAVALGILMGVGVAVPLGLWMRLGQNAGWPFVAAETSAFLVVCGPVMGLILRRQLDGYLQSIGDVPDDVRQRVAARPTAFGSIPQDPAERAATIRLLEHQLGELDRKRLRMVVAWLLVAAPLVWMSLTRSPWWWLLAAAWALLIVLGLCAPRLLRRRLDVLRSGAQ